MATRRVIPASLTLFLLTLFSAGLAQDSGEPPLQELADRLSGSFSSQEQALRDSTYSDIRLRMVPIWPQQSPGYWLYVEQAEADTQDRPYRQRVYHLTDHAPGIYRMQIFALPGDPLAFAGAWKEDRPLDHLQPADLLLRSGCDVLLHLDPEGDFVGETEGRQCESTLRGAAYATSEALIAKDHFQNWDRGFSAAGQQVWGATSGGYLFRVVERWDPPGR